LKKDCLNGDAHRNALLWQVLACHAKAAQRDTRQEAAGAIGQGPDGAEASLDRLMMLKLAGALNRFRHVVAMPLLMFPVCS